MPGIVTSSEFSILFLICQVELEPNQTKCVYIHIHPSPPGVENTTLFIHEKQVPAVMILDIGGGGLNE